MTGRERTALLTGASGGIGKDLALRLAAMQYNLLLVCRDRERASSLAHDILIRFPGAAVRTILADLSVREEVESVANEVLRSSPSLQILINNAGAVSGRRELTADGIEKTFAVNHLSYFRLTLPLIERMKQSAPARIVNVTSETYRYVRFDPVSIINPPRFSPVRAYAESKLANILFSRELAHRLRGSGITVAAVHPGAVQTNIYKSTRLNHLYLKLFGWTMLSPGEGAEHVLTAVRASLDDATSGCYFYRSEMREPAAHARDDGAAKTLWELSEKFSTV